MDQAQGIRQMKAQHPVRVIAVTSGKGGVGKSNVTINLAVSLAQSGESVMVMDADMGLANIDVLLGLSPGLNLSHVINGECSLEETIIEGPAGIKIVPASSGVAAMSDLTPAQNAGVIRSFSELTEPVDTLLIDTAAGLSDSVVSYTRAAREVIVVVCDEPASITDAYAMIKVMHRDYGVERFHVLANQAQGASQGRELYKNWRGCRSGFSKLHWTTSAVFPTTTVSKRPCKSRNRWLMLSLAVSRRPRSSRSQRKLKPGRRRLPWKDISNFSSSGWLILVRRMSACERTCDVCRSRESG